MSAELAAPEPEKQSIKKAALAKRKRDADEAWNLRLAGASYEDIARVVGYATPKQAALAIQRRNADAMKADPEAQNKMRFLAGQRLERLLRGCWAKAINEEHPEHLAAVTKAREIIAQHAKLYGLDAPSEMIVHTPTKQALEEYVDRLVGRSVVDIDEQDIFEAEWSEQMQIEEVSEEGDDDEEEGSHSTT